MSEHTLPRSGGKHSDPDPSPRGEQIPREQWDQMFPGQLRKLADLVDLWLERERDPGSDEFRAALAALSRLADERADERDGLIVGLSAGGSRSGARKEWARDLADEFVTLVGATGSRSWRSWAGLTAALGAPNRRIAREAVELAQWDGRVAREGSLLAFYVLGAAR